MRTRNSIVCFIIVFFILVPWVQGRTQDQVQIRTPQNFKIIKKVIPNYPASIKEEGIEGIVLLNIIIDARGNVYFAQVWKSLHPDLDKLALEACKQWKFEPFIYNGNPIRATAFISVIFSLSDRDSSAMMNETEKELIDVKSEEPLSDELQVILNKCAEYCQNLSAAALDYVCHEKIKEINKNVVEKEIWLYTGNPDLKDNEVMISKYKGPALKDTEKNIFVFDYQLINKNGEIKERRILLEKNGEKISEWNDLQEQEWLYSFKPIFVPAWLLSLEQRSIFLYRLAKEERIKGKKAYVIEVEAKGGKAGDIKSGKIWVDKMNYRIFKVELKTTFLAGHEQTLKECRKYYLKPSFTTVHFYEFEKYDILFPSHSEILVEYKGLVDQFKKAQKSKTEISYYNYRFFTVETDHNIIKKKIETMFKTRDELIFKNSLRLIPCVLRYY